VKPEEQRIAIAEWCGWRHDYDTKNLRAVWISPKSGYGYALDEDFVPDYLNDLNAMHEAEERLLQHDQINLYRDCLFRAVGLNPYYYQGGHLPAVELTRVAHATAAQRAEATQHLAQIALCKERTRFR